MDKSFISRELGGTLLEAANYFPVLCVTGPRQSGKSTLMNRLFPDYKQFSLEDIDIRAAAMEDPRDFLNQGTHWNITRRTGYKALRFCRAGQICPDRLLGFLVWPLQGRDAGRHCNL